MRPHKSKSIFRAAKNAGHMFAVLDLLSGRRICFHDRMHDMLVTKRQIPLPHHPFDQSPEIDHVVLCDAK